MLISAVNVLAVNFWLLTVNLKVFLTPLKRSWAPIWSLKPALCAFRGTKRTRAPRATTAGGRCSARTTRASMHGSRSAARARTACKERFGHPTVPFLALPFLCVPLCLRV